MAMPHESGPSRIRGTCRAALSGLLKLSQSARSRLAGPRPHGRVHVPFLSLSPARSRLRLSRNGTFDRFCCDCDVTRQGTAIAHRGQEAPIGDTAGSGTNQSILAYFRALI
eukprot:4803848-Prymnesium_polylepis.1